MIIEGLLRTCIFNCLQRVWLLTIKNDWRFSQRVVVLWMHWNSKFDFPTISIFDWVAHMIVYDLLNSMSIKLKFFVIWFWLFKECQHWTEALRFNQYLRIGPNIINKLSNNNLCIAYINTTLISFRNVKHIINESIQEVCGTHCRPDQLLCLMVWFSYQIKLFEVI